jgi:hypothetical protein
VRTKRVAVADNQHNLFSLYACCMACVLLLLAYAEPEQVFDVQGWSSVYDAVPVLYNDNTGQLYTERDTGEDAKVHIPTTAPR